MPAPQQDPEPLPYLRTEGDWALDIELEVEVGGTVVSRTNARGLYWTMPQQLAHATVNGASIATGDLFASGTISGPEHGSEGSLIELTRNGEHPIGLADGSTRAFLEDDDEVVLRGRAGELELAEVRGWSSPRAASSSAAGTSRAVQLALEAASEHLGDPLARPDEAVEVDAGAHPLALERVDEVLGGDVAGRPRRERASTEASDRRIQHRGARVERSERVRVPRVPRVVEVTAGGTAELDDAFGQRAHRARRGDADRVREHDRVRRDLGDALGDLDDPARIHLAFERAPERDAERDRAANAVSTRACGDPQPIAMESSTDAPWFRWLNDSVTPNANLTS